MPPKMRTWWVHRELEAMKEIASSDQGGEKDGLVGLGIRLEGTSRLGTFPCCPSMSPVRLMRLFMLDKQHPHAASAFYPYRLIDVDNAQHSRCLFCLAFH